MLWIGTDISEVWSLVNIRESVNVRHLRLKGLRIAKMKNIFLSPFKVGRYLFITIIQAEMC